MHVTVDDWNAAQSAGVFGASAHVFLNSDATALHSARVVPMVRECTCCAERSRIAADEKVEKMDLIYDSYLIL